MKQRDFLAHATLAAGGLVLSDPDAVADQHEATGYVHEVAAREVATLPACDVYVAGPPQLVEAVRAQYPALGVAPGRIRFDSFDYAPVLGCKAPV